MEGVDDDTPKRTRKKTDKGKAYQLQLMEDQYSKRHKKVDNHISVIKGLINQGHRQGMEQEFLTLDHLFDSFVEIAHQKRGLSDHGLGEAIAHVIDSLDNQIFLLKTEVDKKTKSVASSHSSRRSSHSQKAIIAGLEAQANALSRTQSAELEALTVQSHAVSETIRKVKAAQNQTESLRQMEEIARVKATEEVYRAEEAKQEELRLPVAGSASGRSHHSPSSHSSGRSRVSNRSSVVQRALAAGLEAQAAAAQKTREAELAAELVKVQAESEVQRRVKQAQQKLDRLRLDEKLAKARAIDQIYEDEEMKHDAAVSTSSRQSTVPRSDNKRDHSIPAKAPKPIPPESDVVNAKSTNLFSCNIKPHVPSNLTTDPGIVLASQIHKMVKLHSAPDVEIDMFAGNPLEYKYFITNFKEIVESTVDTQRGRLNRLIKYTDGEAKELIKHCIYDEPESCYDKAVTLLEHEYGDKFKISSAYMEELRNWPSIKVNDSHAFKKFHRFLLKCLTLQKNGDLDVLNSPLSIRQIQLKLPQSHQDKWSNLVEKTRRNEKREASFKDFVGFIDFQASVISDPVYSRVSVQKPVNVNVAGVKTNQASEVEQAKPAVSFAVCVFCKASHLFDNCEDFAKMEMEKKRKFLFEEKLCYACHEKGHRSVGCSNRKTCSICQRRHPTSMHVNCTVMSMCSNQSDVIAMSIVPVIVWHGNKPKDERKVYAVIDNCSQGTFATEDLLIHDMEVPATKSSITIQTAIGVSTFDTFKVGDLHVRCTDEHRDLYPDSPIIKLPQTFTRHSIPADKRDIATRSSVSNWNHLAKVAQSLPEYDEDIPIGLLIGLNCPRAQEPYESVLGDDNSPYAVRNALGWCVMGPLNDDCSDSIKCNFIRVQVPSENIAAASKTFSKQRIAIIDHVKDNFVKDRLQEMYMVDFSERGGEDQALSQEDQAFMRLMKDEVRLKDGKYELPLPFRKTHPDMPDSIGHGRSRLGSIKRKMLKDESFRHDYTTFMDEVLAKGYAVKCYDKEDGSWYIPHHGVYHPAKNKIRVVFDCSAQTEGISLNSELLQGPDLTNSLIGVLIRFRREPIAVMGDIEAMYYQVQVPEKHRKFIKFLWWPDGDVERKPQDYQMCVHLFGALSSPSCANFALRQTAIDNEKNLGAETAETLCRDFYVDDMLKSYASTDDAITSIERIREMCAAGGFNLTKFTSNSSEVIASLPSDKRSKALEFFDILNPKWPIERALGVRWCIESDVFGFRINLDDTPLTRRGILSSISSIYDPQGLLSPFLLKGRKILQEITSDTSHWDDEVSSEHVQAWQCWRRSLPALESLRIPRCYKPKNFGEIQSSSLHFFSDASKVGYGVACYLRQVNVHGKIHVSLVIGKSRVSPLKPTTIPRLELTAATVSARVSKMVEKQIAIEGTEHVLWTDSQIVLGYIFNESRRFRVFVANRTQQIRDLTRLDAWRYVDTERNPSDHASRGLVIGDTEKVEQWFNGPSFLWQDKSSWDLRSPIARINEDDPEVQVITNVNATIIDRHANYLLEYLDKRFSCWHKMKRLVATVILFIRKCRREDCSPQISISDLESAGISIIKMAQKVEYSLDIPNIMTGSSSRVQNKSIEKLNPVVDEEGVLRVGGRLSNSEQALSIKFPVILPKNSFVSRRIIEWYHKQVAHGGRCATINEIRSNGIWIVGMNNRVKAAIHLCVPCRGLRGKLGFQKMADLPSNRTVESPPFTHCGVDMFGPFHIKEGRKAHKRYTALFTCFASRAVHLETTNKIDTDSFIMALRRFMSTRGNARSIRSDHGTNFVGADNEMKRCWDEIKQQRIYTFLQTKNCDWLQWEKNTPNASHMGGVWERQIRTARSILESLMKSHEHVLNDESFNTLIKEVECIMNSRPLTVENINDPQCLPITPNHLLTLKSKCVLPPPGEFQKQGVYCRKRWRIVQHLANQFWERWRKGYLLTLQSRQKWTDIRRNFKVGDIVLLKEENAPRNQWPLAKITETLASDDGLVRSVMLLISNHEAPGKTTTLKRPITKIVLLVEAEK